MVSHSIINELDDPFSDERDLLVFLFSTLQDQLGSVLPGDVCFYLRYHYEEKKDR